MRKEINIPQWYSFNLYNNPNYVCKFLFLLKSLNVIIDTLYKRNHFNALFQRWYYSKQSESVYLLCSFVLQAFPAQMDRLGFRFSRQNGCLPTFKLLISKPSPRGVGHPVGGSEPPASELCNLRGKMNLICSV